jgi:uncharacterized membrane protein
MRKMDFAAGTAPADAARAFAKDLHARWGVGDAACNNGVLLLLAIDDRQVYVSTGTGSMKALPDGKIEDIVGDIRHLLRRQVGAKAGSALAAPGHAPAPSCGPSHCWYCQHARCVLLACFSPPC